MLSTVETTKTVQSQEQIDFLRELLSNLLEEQSSPRLSETKKHKCKIGITALRAAIDALEIQVYA